MKQLADGFAGRALQGAGGLDVIADQLTIRARVWSGGAKDVGSASDTDLVIPTIYKISQVTTRLVAQSGGLYEMGDIIAGPITPAWTVGAQSGGFSITQLAPVVSDNSFEIIYVISGAHSGEYQLVEARTFKRFHYDLVLRRRITKPEIFPPGGVGKLPTDVAGCRLWLDTTANVTTPAGNLTWVDTVSGLAFVQSGGVAVPGTNLNGTASVDLSGLARLSCTSPISSVISAAAWTAIVVFKYTGNVADGGAYYSNGSIIGDLDGALGGYWAITTSVTKIDLGQTDGVSSKVDQVPNTPNVIQYALFRYNGSRLQTALNGGAFDVGVPCGSVANMSHLLRIGPNIPQSTCFQGSLGDIAVFNVAVSDSDCAALGVGMKNKFAL